MNLSIGFTIFAICPVLLALSACSRETDPKAADDPGRQTMVVGHILITGNDRMRFEPAEFTVRAGTSITVEVVNGGTMPKESMGHNLAILDGSIGVQVFAAASGSHPATEYLAPEHAGKVIAATRVLGPGESQTLNFNAPAGPGEYPFVCTFPGHALAGMKGVMRVVP